MNRHETRLVITSTIFLFSIISTIVTGHTLLKFEEINLEGASVNDLQAYQKILNQNLKKIREALDNQNNLRSIEPQQEGVNLEEMLTMNEGSGAEDGEVKNHEMTTEHLILTTKTFETNEPSISLNTTTTIPNNTTTSITTTTSATTTLLVLANTVVPSEGLKLLNSSTQSPKEILHSPLSATLPDRNSAYFLGRIGTLRKSPKDLPERINVVASGVKTASVMETLEGENTKKFKSGHFEPTINHTVDECRHLTQAELVQELKQKGTYNPDLMAWDVMGVIRFLDRTIIEQYDLQRQWKNRSSAEEVVERNIEALARIVHELNATCDIRAPHVRQKMANLTLVEPRRTILSPSLRSSGTRFKRELQVAKLVSSLFFSEQKDEPTIFKEEEPITKRHQKLVGESHVIPFGCDKRGTEEAGYLRLCGACQAIRKLPEDFFPPFINEVTCDVDKACLYFYDYPHGKCRQKHMNFVVLRNVGTQKCQVWKKFNLNVRVSCECFVDEMSFFAKYV